LYRYAEQEGMIELSPPVHVRRPRLDYESHATGLDRNQVGAMLVEAGLRGARDHALISLLALNGLRVSEAIGANVEHLGLERGHRTLTITRKGGKQARYRGPPPGTANKGEFCWRYFLRCFTVLPFRLHALEVLQTV
jgi:site-specific recombinase XerD